MNRREFLKAAAVTFLALKTKAAFASQPVVPGWGDDICSTMHELRDKTDYPVPAPYKSVDIVIAGGGLTGLTAAYELNSENFVLLEASATPGGNAGKGVYEGVVYATGSAYIVDIEEPYGKLYSSLGLDMKPVLEPVDYGYLGGKWKALDAQTFSKDFERLKKFFTKFLESDDFPVIPIEDATVAALKLDNGNFYDYLKEKGYPDNMLKFVDAYCYSALGGGINEISAYAGANFYSEIATNIYSFPGGNAHVVDALLNKIDRKEERIKTGHYIYNIEEKDGRILTSYFSTTNPNEYQTIESKAVILSLPYNFIPRIVKDLPTENKRILNSLLYDSYLVANCCFNRRVYKGGYDNWSPASKHLTDFIIADHTIGGNANNHPSVLTVYAPFRNPDEGRKVLIETSPTTLAANITESLHEVVSFNNDDLKEVRLTRFGHQMLTSNVGIVNTIRKLKKRFGKMILAHSDGQALACIEGAITEALMAAREVKKLLKQK